MQRLCTSDGEPHLVRGFRPVDLDGDEQLLAAVDKVRVRVVHVEVHGNQAACGMFAKPVVGSTGKTHAVLLVQPAKLYGSPWNMVPAGRPSRVFST